MPSAGYLSIEQVAQRLQLHVRTVRAYVRSGRLKAVRVGKQYRIAQEELDALTGTPATALPTDKAMRRRHTEIISIIHIDAIDAQEAGRMADIARTAGSGWHTGYKPIQTLTAYDEARKRLKIILSGNLVGVCDALEMIRLLAPSRLPAPRSLRATRTGG